MSDSTVESAPPKIEISKANAATQHGADTPAANAARRPRMRRFFERLSSPLQHLPSPPTFIGADTTFMGDIIGKGSYVVLGTVRGDGDLGGSLFLAAGASWHGHVHAEDAVIAGLLNGSLLATGKIEIGDGAVIHGKVTARTVAIASGAIVDGEVIVTSGQPIIQFEEKRKPR